MMDSFVEAQNNLKRMSYAGCVTLLKRGKPTTLCNVHRKANQILKSALDPAVGK
jgi:hypothetical protein